jgi:hypothetical protein
MSLSRRSLLAAPALVVASGVWAQQKTQAPKQLVLPLRWYQVQVEDNAFSVEMPGIPDHRVLNDKSGRGTPFVLHSYSLEAGGYSYALQTALYPEDVDVSQPRRILQAALDGRTQSLQGRKWLRTDWRDVQGAASVESVGSLAGNNALRQLVLLKERRFISLAFLGAIVTSVEAERFFKSLKLV